MFSGNLFSGFGACAVLGFFGASFLVWLPSVPGLCFPGTPISRGVGSGTPGIACIFFVVLLFCSVWLLLGFGVGVFVCDNDVCLSRLLCWLYLLTCV